MKCRYETRMRALCPITNGFDFYDVIVESDELIVIEKLQPTIDEHARKAFQEEITVQLAKALNATVTTIGYHSGIKTTCTAP